MDVVLKYAFPSRLLQMIDLNVVPYGFFQSENTL